MLCLCCSLCIFGKKAVSFNQYIELLAIYQKRNNPKSNRVLKMNKRLFLSSDVHLDYNWICNHLEIEVFKDYHYSGQWEPHHFCAEKRIPITEQRSDEKGILSTKKESVIGRKKKNWEAWLTTHKKTLNIHLSLELSIWISTKTSYGRRKISYKWREKDEKKSLMIYFPSRISGGFILVSLFLSNKGKRRSLWSSFFSLQWMAWM